jgi:hypothetical protein
LFSNPTVGFRRFQEPHSRMLSQPRAAVKAKLGHGLVDKVDIGGRDRDPGFSKS